MCIPSQSGSYKADTVMEYKYIHAKWKMKGDYPTFNETKHK